MRCVNCGIATQRLRRHEISSLSSLLLAILTQWLLPYDVRSDDTLCHPCFILLNSPNADEMRLYGHTMVCIGCGRSLRRQQFRAIQSDSPLLNYLSVIPHTLRQDSRACFTCWVRCRSHQEQDLLRQRVIQEVDPEPMHGTSLPTAPQMPPAPLVPLVSRLPTQEIRLPIHRRASNVSTHCIFRGCTNIHLHLVPKFIKQLLLKQHKLYVPRSCRVCSIHLISDEWETLPNSTNTFNNFNAQQIEDLINLATFKSGTLVFENVHEMPDAVCHYWTGLTVFNFLALYNYLPALDIKRPKNALAIYLAKLRTGETDRRLTNIFNIPRSTLGIILKRVREWLSHYLVPLGPNHISHNDIVNRSLRIPNALFGGFNEGHSRPAIAIFDGTYVFLQKSSNYLFQKKTYSLHKYDNLVKPFVIVSSDGHIIDVVGPYAATQTDAEIMIDLFRDETSPYRRLFTYNDVFILDRGFRDAIPLLQRCNYQVHQPESLDHGQSQLSYAQANKSRRVTLCRWVVEVVNGRFKRDFKLFRQRFFNLASTHLMVDFKIAASLLNKFHPVLVDGPNAEIIINRVNQYMEVPNYLSIYVNQNNLNRRRAIFVRVDGNLPQLNNFPIFTFNDLLLLALGPYQVKQARSYYGEHVRANGVYQVEVCPDLEQELVENIGGEEPHLLRGRIKSRHISQRMYYTYIVYEGRHRQNTLDSILAYYCSCLVGNRTVGCCCHVMTVVWYLGWARHQNGPPTPPASFLDSVLVRLTE